MTGIKFVEQFTAVRAAFGGVHLGVEPITPCLPLAPKCYLEILAPDPQQNELTWFRTLPQLTKPCLVGWMVHPSDSLVVVADRLRKTGIACDGPRESSRQTPDGRTLRWKLLRLADDRHGLLPILIEWRVDSPHPATDAPSGCRLVRFEISGPQPSDLQQVLNVLGLDLPIVKSDRPQLRASIESSKGILELTS